MDVGNFSGKEGIGYRPLKLNLIDGALLELAQCKFCLSPIGLFETFSHRKGLVSSIGFKCHNSSCGKSKLVSDPHSDEAKSVNQAAILGARLTGNGRNTLDTITACLGMPPPLAPASYSVYSKELSSVTAEVAESKMVEAANYLHHIEKKPLVEVIDTIVTLDGTWQKRGHASLLGVVVVISWKTGLVLDCEVLSKHCSACSVRESMGMESRDFDEWYKEHKSSCDADYEGSSGNMEVVGAERIWRRSVATKNLRYTTIISDGDSRAYNNLCAVQPYGSDVELIKHECVGHVQKRMYYALTTLKKSAVFDDNGKRVKFGGIGRLTDGSIKAINVYYGGAIRNNVGDVDGMIRDINATFFHCVSNDTAPQHQFCPTGEDSWCKYNKAIAKNETPPRIKAKIPRDLARYVRPIFVRLSSRDLLTRCSLGATQNQNESFNKVVWSRASKTLFLSKPTVSFAVNLSVITFNEGMEKGLPTLLKKLGIEPGPRSMTFFKATDKMRLSKSDRKADNVAKRRRRTKARERVVEAERDAEREGPTYGAGQY